VVTKDDVNSIGNELALIRRDADRSTKRIGLFIDLFEQGRERVAFSESMFHAYFARPQNAGGMRSCPRLPTFGGPISPH
jgi:hypothetical protein